MGWRDNVTPIDDTSTPSWKKLATPVAAPKTKPTRAPIDNNAPALVDQRTSDGFFDRAADLLRSGEESVRAGVSRAAGSVARGIGADWAADRYGEDARQRERIAAEKIEGETEWDEVKDNPLLAPKFVAEQGLKSLPGMAVAAVPYVGLATTAVSQSGNIGQQRAENNGRDEATLGDVVKAAPFAVASAALEKVGIKGIGSAAQKTVKGRIAGAAGTEAATEFAQSGLEYTGGTAGTDAGFDAGEALDQSFAGGLTGAGVGGSIRGGAEIVDSTGRVITNRTRRPVAAGATERAVEAVELTDEDINSPLDNDLIMQGKVGVAQAEGNLAADSILRAAGMPETGKQVKVDLGNGRVQTGIVSDAFGEGDARGVTITLADGTVMKEHFDDLADAGVSIRPMDDIEAMRAEADALDAALAVGAATRQGQVVQGKLPGTTRKGSGVPVENAKAVTESLFPGVRVTSWARGKDHALSKKNPNSWHAKSRAAVDVAPIKGMSFEQFVQTYKDAGFTILEAINETGKGKTKHATGDHWHIVVGKGGGTDAELGGPAPGVGMAGASGTAPGGVIDDSRLAIGDVRRASTAPLEPIAARTEDRVDTVATATGREVGVRYAVVEAGDLKPSNLADGSINPDYPSDRQPRDRTRAASQNQVQNIASNLKPYWLGRSVRPDDGAPIIAPNGVVESGNGRSIALRQVYEQGGEKAEEYRRFVESQGIDTAGMEQPVLVRIREDQFSPEEERAFAREANMPTNLGMAPTEQAMADADALSPALLAQYQGGDVDSAANANFVRQFITQIMSPAEAAQLQRADGTPNKTAFVRIRNALLGQAYSNPLLVENVSESMDSTITAIGGALTDVAGPWAKMIDAAKSGNIPASLDITQNLNEAVDVIDKSRREGIKVADIINQRNMFTGDTVDPITEALLRLFFIKPDFTKPAGRARVVTALQSYVKQAMEQRLDQGTLGGVEPTENPSGLLGEARVSQGYEDGQAPSATEAAAEPVAPARERAQPDGRDVERPSGEGLPQDSGEQTSDDVAPPADQSAITKAKGYKAYGQRINRVPYGLSENESAADWLDGFDEALAESIAADKARAAPVDKTPANSDSVAQPAPAPANPQEAVADIPGRPRVIINRVGKDGLTDAERAADIGKALQAKISSDFDAARAEYASIEGPTSGSSDGGRILNTDLARELSPEYRADRSRSAEVHEPASAFVKKMYAKMLSEPVADGKDKNVLFTAGGTGAGKSTGMNLLPDSDTAGIVFDTNMNTLESARQKVDQALDAGWFVNILYTYRDPIEALQNGALPRAERMGRTVPLSAHIETHVGSRETVAELAQIYKNDTRVLIEVADNSRGKGNAELVPLENIPKINDVGLYERAEETVRTAFEAGRISEATLRGTLAGREGRSGQATRGPVQVDGASDRGQPEPQRDGPSPVTPAPAPIAPKPADYGANNKIVSTERAAELRKRLKEKLSPNRLNAGVDPEILAIGAELAVFHIEAGARRFQAFAKAVAADLDMPVESLRKYLRGWYNGARDMMEDMGESVVDMDGADAVAGSMRTLADWTGQDYRDTIMPENDNGLQRTIREGDAGAGTADVPRPETVGRADGAPVGEEPRSAQPVRADDSQSGEATERGSEGSGSDAGSRARSDSATGGVSGLKGQNWVIEPGGLNESRGPAQKARDNIRAIEIVKELDREGRMATVEEQSFIAQYVGWGGLKNAFPDTDGNYGKGFETVGPRLRELLDDSEYETARRSIQYAHYTSEKVVRPMWELARRLGFNGGAVFEPGMGTGNFAGMMPRDIAVNTMYGGLEYDKLTARIAHHLYPMWGVRQADYTDTPQIMEAFDLVIGNPPFSATVIKGDPVYGKFGFMLHDFFFAKSLDAVKPGGVLMFVTSAGTMNKIDAKAREYLAERADLLGAIRLPNDAFAANAGTRVTTDIVVLRKRAAVDAPQSNAWTDTATMELPNREGGISRAAVSQYFVDNPDMILGEQGMFDQLTAGERYGVRSKPGVDLEAALTEAIGRITIKPLTSVVAPQIETMGMDFAVTEQKEGSFYLADNGDVMRREGGVGRKVQAPGKGVTGGISKDNQDKVRQLVKLRDTLRETIGADLRGDAPAAAAARKSLNDAYDAFVGKHGPINKSEISFRRPNIIQQESARFKAREDARTNGIEWRDGEFDDSAMIDAGMKMQERARARADAREAAQKAGRTFDEGTWSPADMDDITIVKRPNIDFFMSDQEGYRLRSIEHYNDDTGTAKKGIVFTENPIAMAAKPAINSVEDALLYVMNRHGKPILSEIAREADMTQAEVLDRIGDALFQIPGTNEYETRELYLSGNVREKLDVARAAAEGAPEYVRNVEALEAVQPAPLSQQDIAANLGMPWIPPTVIEEFGRALGLSSLKVKYTPKLARWDVSGDQTSAVARSTWGTEDREAPLLIWDALNRVTPKVMKEGRGPDGQKTRAIDPIATQAAQDKMLAIKDRFRSWVWEDEARTATLTELYNREYNSRVAPKFDGGYLKTPGISSMWRWRPHQSAVVARIIQTGNTYMAHGVGAGKTSAMIGAGMEMKRLGLVNKPAYAVPNHMLGQFTKEFYEQYPSARIMVADETRFHTDRRKQFISDVANNDIDAVILTHSAFGLLPISPKFEAGMVDEQIQDYRDLLGDIPKDQENRITRSRIEKQVEQLEQRLKALGNRKKDQVYTFEETGIDFMFVDEAHLFRKLAFSTKMAQVKGIDPDGSQMSFDLYSKIKYLEGQKPGRSIVLASGTPITNTMAELFTVQRYMQGGELEKLGLGNFDAWAGSFGDTDTRLEQDPAGNYAPVTRFAKFVNVPELSVMVRQFMDVVTSQELESLVVRPKLKGGKRNLVIVEQTPAQEAYQETLRRRIAAIQARKGPPAKGDDILLSVINDGRKSAIDMRLIDRNAPKEDTKLEAMIANVFRIWKDSKRAPFYGVEGDGYTKEPVDYGPAAQMVFADLGVNENENSISVHQYIRAQLMQRGVPAREIALIGDYNNHVKKQRLFNDVNEGKVRVLIGSAAKMGTGVNAQTRLIANHNQDAQWYPAIDEQRNGRIIRQGNMNPEVEIYDYSTKGTYDSTMWGLMETKGRFIEGFMRGDPTMRDMEDIGEASQYEQAKALTTSDERVIVLTEYRQSLDKALRRRDAFQREQAANKRAVVEANSQIARSAQRVREIEADIAQRVDVTGDKFTAKGGSVTFTERAKFGEDLLQQVDAMKQRTSVSGKPEKIGEMGGFGIYAEARSFAGEILVDTYIKTNGDGIAEIKETNSATGMVSMIAQRLANFETQLDYNKGLAVSAQAKIAEYTPRLGGTFEGAAEIVELQDKIEALETELSAETKGVPPALVVADESDMLGGPTATEKREALEREGEAPKRAEVLQRPAGSDGGLFDTQGQNELFSRTDEPVATLTGKELGKIPPEGKARMLLLRNRAIQYYVDNLEGRTIIASDGREVMFSKQGGKKSTSKKGEILLRAIPAIEALIKNGAVSDVPWRADRTMKAQMFSGAVIIDGQSRMIGAIVRTDENGNRHYDLTFKKDFGADPLAKASSALESVPEIEFDIGSEVNLLLLDEQVNNGGVDDSALSARLTALGLSDKVALQIVEAMNGAAGSYRPADRLISVARDAKQDRLFTIDHEAVHAMRDMGLLTKSEYLALSGRARSDLDLMKSVKRRYANLDAEAQVEEAVADLFARWAKGRREKGIVGKVFDRIRDVLDAIRTALGGRTTAETAMRSIDAGRVGARDVSQNDAPSEESFSLIDNARASMVAAMGKPFPAKAKITDGFDRWRTAIQDRYLPLLRTQQAVEQQLGRPITADENPYLGEELMTGRIGAKLEMLTDDMVTPLTDAMHAEGIDVDGLESYLYARHAPERNARIAKINPDFAEGEGSGMTDIEARAIMARIERSGQMDAMKRLAKRVDDIRDWALNERVKAGLMSQDEMQAWKDTYTDYVPLRGKGEAGTDSADGIRINKSSGINVRGKESRAAYGRRSRADSILAYSILQAEEAIVRGETNLVAQKFVQLAQKAPDKKFWAVDKVTRKPVMDRDTGLVRYEDQTRVQAEDKDYTVTAKFNGEETRVTMNRDNPAAARLADSMRNLTQQQLDWLTLHLGKVNRFLSAVNTSWNPEFVITNAFRDIQTATINLAGFDSNALITGTLKDYRKAMVASVRGAFKSSKGGEWQRWYDEFTKEGGRVYFNQIEDIGGIKDRMRKAFEMSAAKGKPGMNLLTAKRGFVAVRDFVDAANTGVENAIRLSAYKNAREGGMSKQDAASLAKNLTVNFNRRGTMGPALNAAYLFFNASVQGSTRMLLAMKSKRVRKILAGVVVGGFMLEMLNAMLTDDDEDGESFYDKISDFDKTRNLIFMVPGGSGEHIKIPLPYGYNAVYNTGRSLAEMARRGGDRWQESMGNWTASVVDAFNPVGGTESLLNFLAPTILDPVVDIQRNRDFTDRPISPEGSQYGPEEPDAQKYYSSVGPQWKAVTDMLTSMTGGSDIEPGAIDVSPETLEYLSGVVFGAAGGFLDRNVGLGAKMITEPGEITANDLPLARKVIGQKPSWYDKSAYYDRVNTVEQAVDYAKGYIEREDFERFDTFVDSNEKLLTLEAAAKAAQKDMREIRKARRESDFAREMDKTDADTYREEKAIVKDAETLVVQRFNTLWNETMLPPKE